MTLRQKSDSHTTGYEPRLGNSLSKPNVLLVLVFVVTFLSYVLLLTKTYYWDGIFFAQTIEDAPRLNASLVHPSHLLDMVFQYVIYRAVLLAGFHPRALTVLQISNCVFGAAAACVLFRICLESFKSVYVSLILTALFGFSATWWKFSTDANGYILAVFLLLLCFYLVLPGRRSRPFVLALVHALAMFIHELSVLFFPIAVAGLILQYGGKGRNKAIKCVAKYFLTVLAVTVAVYFYVFYLATGSLYVRRFATWITYFSPEHGFTFSVWNNLTYSVRSQWRVFFGGRLSVVRDLWGPMMATLVVATLLIATAFFVVLLRRFAELKAALLTPIRNRRQFRSLTVLCGIWVLVYGVFLFFFIPQNAFYRLFYLPAIVLLAGTVLAAVESAPMHVRRYRAALFAAVLFFSNLTLSQYPYSQAHANPPLQLARKLNHFWPTGTIVYFADPNSDNLLVRYINPGSVWIQATPAMLMKELGGLPRARSGWLDTTLIDQFEATPEGKSWMDAHTLPQPETELVNRKFRIRFRQLRPESFDSAAK